MKVEIGMVSGKIIIAEIPKKFSMKNLSDGINRNASILVENPERILNCKNIEYIEVQS